MQDLSPTQRALAAALAQDLAEARYAGEALRELWGDVADAALTRGDAVPARRALSRHPHSALATIASLFLLGDTVAEEKAARALGHVGVNGASALELVSRVGDRVQPAAVIRPYAFTDGHGTESWWIASDLDELAGVSPLRDDHVLGVGGAGRTLAGLLGEDPVASALDLGCGCGIQALHLSRSAARVVATDISPRALWFTALNTALNGVSGIQTRLGSLFEPVAGEAFDRIAANPPFVITPRSAGVPVYEYRDGGLEGDDLMAAVVAEIGAHLAPRGVATLLGNWEARAEAPGLDRVRGWVDGSPVPLDAWVLERERLDPAQYAEVWVRDGGTRPGSAQYENLLAAWLDDFDRRGVRGVGLGWVLLRRPADEPTLARYESVTSAAGRVSGIVATAFVAHDRLEALGNDGLAASTLLVAPDVTEARHHLPGEEGPTVIELRQGGGLARTLEVDSALAAVVGACDGDLPVGVLIDAVAQLLDLDAGALRADLLPRLEELVFTGFLRFA
jgi:methylase of polypeptide subunit release factors